jgi:peptidoglycan/xylan/chitin deacetylase (PgdA/CDA1 family)
VSSRRRRGHDVLVLCYHGISDGWPDPLAVGPERLRSQVEVLLRRGWRAAAFTDAVTAPPHERTLAVTFDDALRSVARLALPVLRELDVPATVFVPTGFVGGGRPFAWPETERWLATEHAGELEGMSWAELAELSDAGWEIGSHSVSHAHLTALDDERLGRELRESREAIESRVGLCRSVAYPYSDFDDRVTAAAEAVGYEAGAAVLPVRDRGGRMCFPRVPVFSSESRLTHRLHLSRPVRRLQATRPWYALRRGAERVVSRAT